VATTTVEKLLDYVANTPEDGMRSKVCVEQRCRLIENNLRLWDARRTPGAKKLQPINK
jgi:4-O-beta-D-mannosyl-D-glucose phosphorylase